MSCIQQAFYWISSPYTDKNKIVKHSTVSSLCNRILKTILEPKFYFSIFLTKVYFSMKAMFKWLPIWGYLLYLCFTQPMV